MVEDNQKNIDEFDVRDVADGYGRMTHFEIRREEGGLESLTDFQIHVANLSARVLMSPDCDEAHNTFAYVLHYANRGMREEGEHLPDGYSLGDVLFASIQHAVSIGICHAMGKPIEELALTEEQSAQLEQYNRRKSEQIDQLHASLDDRKGPQA